MAQFLISLDEVERVKKKPNRFNSRTSTTHQRVPLNLGTRTKHTNTQTRRASSTRGPRR